MWNKCKCGALIADGATECSQCEKRRDSDRSLCSGSVYRLRKLEESLPIGYTLIDTETLRQANGLIALEFGRSSPLSRKIDAIIKDGLSC